MESDQHVVVMSLSPFMRRGFRNDEEGGRAYQRTCVRSWQDAGALVISVNTPAEISTLEPSYPGVLFVESTAAKSASNPKGLPHISELISAGQDNAKNEVFAIANSDVLYEGDSSILSDLFSNAREGVIFSHRFERSPIGTAPGLPYLYGFDVVIANKRFLLPSELEGFFIGSPWWDYLFLYLLAARNVPIINCISPLMSHMTHDQAWNNEAWLQGLFAVSRRLREMAMDEGPVAALLGYICHSLDADRMPGFAVGDMVTSFGITLGTAMVSYINQSCSHVVRLDAIERGPISRKLTGNLVKTKYVHAMNFLDM